MYCFSFNRKQVWAFLELKSNWFRRFVFYKHYQKIRFETNQTFFHFAKSLRFHKIKNCFRLPKQISNQPAFNKIFSNFHIFALYELC